MAGHIGRISIKIAAFFIGLYSAYSMSLQTYFLPEMGVWLVLGLAIVLALGRHCLWPVALAASLMSALLSGLIDESGIAIIALGGGAAWLATKASGWKSWLLQIFVVLWAVALAAHLLPGFNNLNVLDQVTTGDASTPFSLYFNLDKPMLIFAFLLLMPGMLQKDRQTGSIQKSALAGVTLLSVFLIGWSIGLIKPELSVPEWIVLFAFNNLLLTSVAEEVFFRGYLQNTLARFGMPVAIGLSSLLFGLAHFSGGVAYVVLAALAGACYGVIYWASGRLYIAILAHFGFNMIHLICFTYPFSLGSTH